MTTEYKDKYYDEVVVGEEIKPLYKEISLPRMMAYGAATWDFVSFHYDSASAQQVGFKAPVVDGQMIGAFLVQMVQEWAGKYGFVRKLSFRNKRPCFPGDLLTCRGVVAGRYSEGEECLVTCDLWIENQAGERVVEPASAVVRVPKTGGPSRE